MTARMTRIALVAGSVGAGAAVTAALLGVFVWRAIEGRCRP